MKRFFVPVISFALLCGALVFGALAQGPGGPWTGPAHEVWLGPSVGRQWTGYCTATGTTPQTCNATKGSVTTGTLTTAAVTAGSYVINNVNANTNSVMSCQLASYSGTLFTNGLPQLMTCTPGAGTITIGFANVHASNALNGTITWHFTIED